MNSDRMKSASAGLYWACLLGLLTAAAAQAEEPRAWLDRMAEAVETLNYEGTFVHVHQDGAETLFIIHRYMDGKVSERVVSLDGPQREIVRHEDEITCILPDRRVVLVAPRQRGGPLQAALPDYHEAVNEHYELALVADSERVAGRPARVLQIRPVDSYRYGFRLWLDEATAMPLKSQMLDEQGAVVEQILFTSISMPEHIPASALEPTTDTEGFTWYRRREGGEQQGTAWQATELPAGFRLTAASVDTIVGAGQPVHHLVYSDGLAAVSIFVEETRSEIEWPVGLSRVGSSNAYTMQIEGGVVTAVGEVPAVTVRTIARSLRRGDSPVTIDADR